MLVLAATWLGLVCTSYALARGRSERTAALLASVNARATLEHEAAEHLRGDVPAASVAPIAGGDDRPRTNARLASLSKTASAASAPDAWERGALEALRAGGERESVEPFQGTPHLRVIRAMPFEAACQRCHADARLGEARGGVSVAVPIAPYATIMRGELRAARTRHVAAGALGLGVLGIAALWLERARRAREGALREREAAHARLDETLGAADVGTWEIDLTTERLTVDARWAKLHGLSPAEIGPDADFARTLVHPDDRARQGELFREALERGTAIEFEHRARHASGAWIWVLLRARVAARDAQGQPLRFGGTAYDVTARRAAEEAALHASSTLRALMESTAAAVLYVTEDRHIGFFNEAFRTLVGPVAERMKPGDPEAQHLRGAAPMFEEPRAFGEMIARAYAGRMPLRAIEHAMVDGRVIESDYAPVVADGERIGHLWHFRDVTERARLQERLRQGERLETVGRLAAGVAHDFNNVLTTIEGNASLLLDTGSAVEAADGREMLDEILRASEHAATLVKQLLLFGRKQPLARRPLDVSALAASSARMLRRALGERFEVLVDLREGLPLVRADAALLEQALLNLALNARDAMPKGGRIWLSTREAAPRAPRREGDGGGEGESPTRWVCLEVRDAGEGIPEEHRDHVFEPFFTTKELGQGTGLGLASVHGCVAQHGGTIELESEIGRGTTFRVFLPAIVEEAERASIPTPAPPASARGGGETILLVEDEAPVRALVCRILERHGYRVTTAASAEEASQLPAEALDRVSLLLSDMVTPGGIDGHELAERLRAVRPALRVILYSGYPDDGVTSGYPFLAKPFEPAKLLAMVKEQLGAR